MKRGEGMGGQGPHRLSELRNRLSTVDGRDEKKNNDNDDRRDVPSPHANDTVLMTSPMPSKNEQSTTPVW